MRRAGKLTVTALAAVLAALALAPAAGATPTGIYAPFAQCQFHGSPEYCLYSVLGGSYTVGTKTVPLVNPITFQGGWAIGGSGNQFYGAENGETLSTTPEPVPGGLVGTTAPNWWPQWLKDSYNNTINNGFTGITATIELAEPASAISFDDSNLIAQTGTALGLPVKIKLENPFLGSNCYIGSAVSPIHLELTTGTSGSLAGSAGTLTFNPNVVTITGAELVDGVFSVPGVTGCGGIASFLVNPFVNSLFGLPAASGNNRAELEVDLEAAEAAEVLANDM